MPFPTRRGSAGLTPPSGPTAPPARPLPARPSSSSSSSRTPASERKPPGLRRTSLSFCFLFPTHSWTRLQAQAPRSSPQQLLPRFPHLESRCGDRRIGASMRWADPVKPHPIEVPGAQEMPAHSPPRPSHPQNCLLLGDEPTGPKAWVTSCHKSHPQLSPQLGCVLCEGGGRRPGSWASRHPRKVHCLDVGARGHPSPTQIAHLKPPPEGHDSTGRHCDHPHFTDEEN